MSTFYFDCRVCGEETGTAHSGSDPDALICEYCEAKAVSKMSLPPDRGKRTILRTIPGPRHPFRVGDHVIVLATGWRGQVVELVAQSIKVRFANSGGLAIVCAPEELSFQKPAR